MNGKDRDKVHRVVKIESGKIDYVSNHIANDPEMLLEYGYILQPLPEEDKDLEKENVETVESENKTKIIIDSEKIEESVQQEVKKRTYNKQQK